MGQRAFAKKISGTAANNAALKVSQVTSWSFRENAGVAAAATVLLRKGTVAGDVVVAIELQADGSAHAEYHTPLDFSTDDTGAVVAGQTVFVDIAAGTVQGSVHGF